MALPGWCSKLNATQTVGKGMLIVLLLIIFSLVVYPQVAARQVVLVVDGETESILTRAKTVGQVIAEKGFQLRDGDLLFPAKEARVERGMEIRLKRAAPFFVEADGRLRLVYSAAATVVELLSELGISLGLSDRVEPGLNKQLEEGNKIYIRRVRKEVLREEVAIPFKTQHVNDAGLASGRRKVVVAGKPGILVRKYEKVYVDGKEEERNFLEEERISEPVNSLVHIGTKKAAPIVVARARDGRVGRVIEGLASWYGAAFHGNRTAYGDIFDKNKMTAASPSRELAGKMVRVTYLRNGRSVDVLINDYGPHLPGRVIDLSMAAACYIGMLSAGVGKVRVEVLE